MWVSEVPTQIKEEKRDVVQREMNHDKHIEGVHEEMSEKR